MLNLYRLSTVTACMVLLVVTSAPALAATPQYTISARIGLFDADHTDTLGLSGEVGYHNSSAREINSTGMVAGNATYFVGVTQQIFDDFDAGRSAWVYNGSTTTRVGLFGPAYTSTSGLQSSRVSTLTDAGNAYGSSSTYIGDSEEEDNAWYYNATAGTTTFLGFTDAEHTNASGEQRSYGDAHPAGYAAGVSFRYDGVGANFGQTAWLHDGTTLTALGFTDVDHTQTSGFRQSNSQGVNASGQVAGTSTRYDGNSYHGQSAWFYNGVTTTRVGLFGAGYTDINGEQYAHVQSLNNAGQVGGQSRRYDGTSTNSIGNASWIHDSGAGSPTMVGLYDAEHTRDDGEQNSYFERMNQAGQAYGNAQQYDGTPNSVGNSVWFHNGVSSQKIGLSGAAYTNSDGGEFNSGYGISESGKVMGLINTFDGLGNFTGESAWVFDGTTTTDIGITSPALLNNDGGYYQQVGFLNDAGFVAGSTSNDTNQAVWIYDPTSGTTHEIPITPPSPLGPNEVLFADISIIGDAGDALGAYSIYNELNESRVGGDAFYWSQATGTIPLGDLITGGLSAAGWLSLQNVDRETNVLGQLLGEGLDLSGTSLSQYAFLLTPTIDGDLDGDGFVGITDLNIILGAWNQTVPPGNELADPSGDGFVGIQDLNFVLGNWNAGTPPVSSTVPEPASLALLSLGGLALLRRCTA